MCGRFTLRTNPHLLAEIFRVLDSPDVKPRYNISPTQSVLTVKASDGGRAFDLMKWGLIPSWAKEAKIGNSMINARAETVRTKPGFRSAFKSRRCLVVADGFYEWKPDGKAKQPYLIAPKDGKPFAFAGLWETWQNVRSCTIVTMEANAFMSDIHHRMPVVLAADDYDRWMACDVDEAEKMLTTGPGEGWAMTPVDKIVNSPKNDVAACVVPINPA